MFTIRHGHFNTDFTRVENINFVNILLSRIRNSDIRLHFYRLCFRPKEKILVGTKIKPLHVHKDLNILLIFWFVSFYYNTFYLYKTPYTYVSYNITGGRLLYVTRSKWLIILCWGSVSIQYVSRDLLFTVICNPLNHSLFTNSNYRIK